MMKLKKDIVNVLGTDYKKESIMCIGTVVVRINNGEAAKSFGITEATIKSTSISFKADGVWYKYDTRLKMLSKWTDIGDAFDVRKHYWIETYDVLSFSIHEINCSYVPSDGWTNWR